MAKIDRLGWAAGVSIRAYGLRIGIRVSEPGALETLAACLPPRWTPSSSPLVDQLFSFVLGGPGPRASTKRFYVAYAGSARIARETDFDRACEALRTQIRLFIAEHARRRVFVHAGVVGWQGRAIVLPGRSHAGKSELVAALVRAGASYLSDEYAVFDGHGRVHPYASPLSLRRGESEVRLTAGELGGRSAARPLPVGLVAFAEYHPGARWRPRPLTAAQALLVMVGHAFPVRSKPAATLEAFDRALASAIALKGARGEAEPVAHALLQALNAPHLWEKVA